MSVEPITMLDDWRNGQRCPWSVTGSKRRWLARSASSVDTVLVHATGVLGGFGITPAQWKAARAAHPSVGAIGTPERQDFDPAHMARVARYRKTPYHGVYSPRDRMSVVQWPATDLTYHGNRPNAVSVGWAYDGKFTPSDHDEIDVDGGRESLRHLIREAIRQGCPLSRITAHANHAPPPRYAKPHDPGARVWLDVVMPVADEFGLDLAPDWTTGGAQPWVRRWMDEGAQT